MTPEPVELCKYCHGAGVIVYEDSVHPCWCVRDDDDTAEEGW